jgi:hypothetical protein
MTRVLQSAANRTFFKAEKWNTKLEEENEYIKNIWGKLLT